MKDIERLAQEYISNQENKNLQQENIQSRNEVLERLTSAVQNINLSVPDTQSMNLEVSLKGIKELVSGLDLIIQELGNIISAIKYPEINIPDINFPEIPEFPDEISINNLTKIEQLLKKILEKKNELPVINIPDFPQEITVSNMFVPKEDSKLIRFYWKNDNVGNLSEFVEVYEDKIVTSTGWNMNNVKITTEYVQNNKGH